MTKLLISAIAALALAGPAFAKAHDQGVADGGEPLAGPGEVAGFVDNVVRDGLSGDADTDAPGNANAEGRRAAKSDNGVKPVVGNGANSR